MYAYTKREEATIAGLEKELSKSIAKSTDLYYHIFLLITEVQHQAFLKIDAARNRRMASDEDLHPNTRFIDNPVIRQIADNRKFKTYVRNNLVSLSESPEVVRLILSRLQESEFYRTYMELPEVTYSDHKQLVLNIISELIAPDEDFYEAMEEKSIFWNDDFELTLSIAYKTVKNLREEQTEETLIFIALYNDEEDEEFARRLFRKTILDWKENTTLIDFYTHNWDIDRVSDIEKIILNLAITELQHFPSIPVKVTFDEYIEIAKSYSSVKSSSFINGVLDKILARLTEEGKVKKMGRGLMQ